MTNQQFISPLPVDEHCALIPSLNILSSELFSFIDRTAEAKQEMWVADSGGRYVTKGHDFGSNQQS